MRQKRTESRLGTRSMSELDAGLVGHVTPAFYLFKKYIYKALHEHKVKPRIQSQRRKIQKGEIQWGKNKKAAGRRVKW